MHRPDRFASRILRRKLVRTGLSGEDAHESRGLPEQVLKRLGIQNVATLRRDRDLLEPATERLRLSARALHRILQALYAASHLAGIP